MKCPECDYISADSHDLCPRCRYDCRESKKHFGLPVTNPDASYSELLAEQSAQADKQARLEAARKDIQRLAQTMRRRTGKAKKDDEGS